MNTISRRAFLAGLGISGVGLLAGCRVSVSGDPAAIPSTPTFSPGIDGRTLVVVEMRGGNDGLSMIVPHADSRYRALRPTLAVEEPIDLDGEIGLHPGLEPLRGHWDTGRLAIVDGVGYPEPDLSHFASLQVWWSGDPTGEHTTGWLGRYLMGAGLDDPLAVISVAPRPSPMLASSAPVVSINSNAGLVPDLGDAIDPETLRATWESVLPADDSDGPFRAVVMSQRAAIDASRSLEALFETIDSDDDAFASTGGDAYAARADAFSVAAALVGAPNSPRVVHVEVSGDFDTHQGHAQRYPALAETVGAGIATIWDAVVAAGRENDVVVMTASEFGRRAGENGDGLDHGTAAPHLVLGGTVRGGRVTPSPRLDALDTNGNLVATTDVRAYYGTVLGQFFGVDPEPVLGSGHDELALFA